MKFIYIYLKNTKSKKEICFKYKESNNKYE